MYRLLYFQPKLIGSEGIQEFLQMAVVREGTFCGGTGEDGVGKFTVGGN